MSVCASAAPCSSVERQLRNLTAASSVYAVLHALIEETYELRDGAACRREFEDAERLDMLARVLTHAETLALDDLLAE